MQAYQLTDFEWGVIAPLLPNKPRGVPRVDDRRVLNGIFWVLRTGAPWRALPKEFGPPTTCYNRFVRWRKAGVWDRVMAAVSQAFDGDVQMIDSTSVRVHQHAANSKKATRIAVGRSRGGLTTKIHALTDARGLPLELILTPGQAGDCPVAAQLLGHLRPDTIVLADKAYDADWLRRQIEAAGAAPNIPPMVHRRRKPCFSPALYRARNRIERFFNRIKHFRRLATRYEKHAANFLAMLKLAATHLWLRHNESVT
ncbi:MAG: IS5 family transposase [Alphaproteobacteria bacterium]|nr:MAG: IS5 family transposase [Alphaproteobacteria bacterium]